MSIEVEGDRAWLFDIRTCGGPDEPLHGMLRWIVQQLHLGCWSREEDELGDVTTLIVGKDAAPSFDEPVVRRAIEHDQKRQLALDLARLFAQSREGGVEPKYAGLSEHIRLTATHDGQTNTEFHYAFELLDILKRIREKTFVFTSPPIKGALPDRVSHLLREATRAYLFKLNRSCVALCRALLESALSERVNSADVLQERMRTKRGELECVISVATRTGMLKGKASSRAHVIRMAGNAALHGDEPSDDTAWGILLDVRHILEGLAAASEGP